MAQVVIVGAGPVGATLALLLVQRGIAVQLVESSRSFRRQFRGEALMPSGLEALEQMGLLPLLDSLPHRPLDVWEFWINQRLLFRVEEPMEAGGRPCTLVSQPALLEALIEQASTYPHFKFVQGTAVQELLWAGEQVTGVRLSNGEEQTADLVIGTDGRNSAVRQHAQLSIEYSSDQHFNVLWFKLATSPRFEADNIFYSILQDRDAFGLFCSSESHLQVGWVLHDDAPLDWKQVDWVETLAATSPPWLAEHFRTQAQTLERPVLLSIVVGRCPQWSKPGVLLLGDAAHPMSPIRAQGINMALRDGIVAANHLVPLLQQQEVEPGAIATALSTIQAEREPEIIRVQQLQRIESAQAERLHGSAVLRWGVSHFAPLIRQPIRYSWLRRQRQLRQGVKPIQLTV